MSAGLRVLMVADVSPSRPLGGGERMLWEQARHLAARGHDVRIVSRADPDATAPVAIEPERVRIQQFLADRRSIARFIQSSIFGARRAVSEALARQAADVLHVRQRLAGDGALASRAGARLPSLYSFYSPAPLEYRSRQRMTARHRTGLVGATGTALLWAIERACLKRARLVHVLSDFSADQLWKLYAVPRERIVRIRGAAATDRFQPAPDRGAIRQALGLSADRSLLLTVRNLEARMGLDTLLDAMARLKARRPSVALLIGGAGSLRAALEAQSQALGLADHVTFLGFVPDEELPRYYQAADLFVLPTRELEGFGLVTIEALACGTPVLGTPVGATPEILRGLSLSLVFRGTAPEVMAEDLERFLAAKERDPDAYAGLRAACRERVERCYTWARATGELEGALRHVASAGRVAAPPETPPRLSGVDPGLGCPACGGPTRPSPLVYRGVRYRRCASCGRAGGRDGDPGRRRAPAVSRRHGRHGDPGQRRRSGSRADDDPARGPPGAGRRRTAGASRAERALSPSLGAAPHRARAPRANARMGHVSRGPPLRVHARRAPAARRARRLHRARDLELGRGLAGARGEALRRRRAAAMGPRDDRRRRGGP